jgi:hypothetical protein
LFYASWGRFEVLHKSERYWPLTIGIGIAVTHDFDAEGRHSNQRNDRHKAMLRHQVQTRRNPRH